MSEFLYRLGSWSYRKVWPFLAVWLILLGILSFGAANYAKIPQRYVLHAGHGLHRHPGGNEPALRHCRRRHERSPASIIIQAPEDTTLVDPDVMGQVNGMLDELKNTGELRNPEEIVNPVLAAGGMAQQMGQAKAAQGMPQEQIDADLAALSPLSPDQRTGTVNITFN